MSGKEPGQCASGPGARHNVPVARGQAKVPVGRKPDHGLPTDKCYLVINETKQGMGKSRAEPMPHPNNFSDIKCLLCLLCLLQTVYCACFMKT